MPKSQKILVSLFTVCLILCFSVTAYADQTVSIAKEINDTETYLLKTVANPQVGSVGGEWAVIGLSRSGCAVPETWYDTYYKNLVSYVQEQKGILHDKKYTEYARVILALTAIGKDPTDVAGYNLLTPLGDYDKTIWQGLNGPIWALISLDSGNYAMPVNSEAKTQATRDMYVDRILACQLSDGGFSLFGGTSSASAGDAAADPDITAMALQALSKYQSRPDVAEVTGEALTCLSKMQDSKGGYSSWGTTNSESVAQVIVALGELGIPLDDSRFVKNGCTLLDNLLSYYVAGGGFLHTTSGSGLNQMATEQAFYALVSAQRNTSGANSLYDMTDVTFVATTDGPGTSSAAGLAGKNDAVTAQPITKPGATYNDISGHENKAAIEALAARAIINGYDDGTFRPDNTMTRAEFAAIVVRALGLTPASNDTFTDVWANKWYAPYVGTANTYGIVNGVTTTAFNPEGDITRQEAAVMVARAAKLCGLDTALTTGAIRDMLAQFTDYVQVDNWAQEAMAFCYGQNILDQSDLAILPKTVIKRCEIAQMLFNLLENANLL